MKSTLQRIFDYIKENAKLCRLLLSERGDISFQKKVMIIAYDKIINELTDNNKISRRTPVCIFLRNNRMHRNCAKMV